MREKDGERKELPPQVMDETFRWRRHSTGEKERERGGARKEKEKENVEKYTPICLSLPPIPNFSILTPE